MDVLGDGPQNYENGNSFYIISFTFVVIYFWRARHSSRSSMENAIRIYIHIYIYIHETHFSGAVLGLRNVGGVKYQPFLKHSNHWKRH